MAGDFISVSFNNDDDDDDDDEIAFVCSEIAGMTVCRLWLLIHQNEHSLCVSVCLCLSVLSSLIIIIIF